MASSKTAATGIEHERVNSYVAEIKAGRSDLFPQLWESLEKLCAWYCRRLFRQFPQSFLLEYEDLFNCGFIALHDAVSHFDPDKDGKFSFFYLFYLTGAIYRKNRLPQGRRSSVGERKQDPAICKSTISIDAPIDTDDENPKSLHDLLQDEDAGSQSIAGAIERIYLEQLRAALNTLIRDLPKAEQHMIRRLYFDNADRKTVAREIGVGIYEARKIEDRAMRTLYREGRAVGLEQFIDENVNYYRGNGYHRFRETQESSVERLVEKRIELEERYNQLIGTAVQK